MPVVLIIQLPLLHHSIVFIVSVQGMQKSVVEFNQK